MIALPWVRGRQAGGYDKLKLLESKRLKFDLYVLRFPEGSRVPLHHDPAPIGHRHHRINLTLRFAKRGGLTLIEKSPLSNRYFLQERWIYKFRPDALQHLMTEVKEGDVLMLSLGWLSKD